MDPRVAAAPLHASGLVPISPEGATSPTAGSAADLATIAESRWIGAPQAPRSNRRFSSKNLLVVANPQLGYIANMEWGSHFCPIFEMMALPPRRWLVQTVWGGGSWKCPDYAGGEANGSVDAFRSREAIIRTIKGPGIFLAQFLNGEPATQQLETLAKWAADLGYVGVQLPAWSGGVFDLEQGAESQSYCDEVVGTLAEHGLEITELSTHLQGQLIAVHPAYDSLFDGFAPPELHGRPGARQEWATAQLKAAAKASRRLGLNGHATFSGALAWPYFYPWPQRPDGLVEEAFAELARRWRPILDAFDDAGVDVCYEIHPGEDLHDGATFERFLEQVRGHPRAHILYDPSHFLLQQLNYLDFIDIYHERIRAFHVKDAEFRPSGRSGIYGGYQSWTDRPGRFRSPGDGQVDFRQIFSKLAQYDYPGWAVLEWECALKHSEDGAKEGAPFIRDHIIRVTDKSFDDFANSNSDRNANRSLLGLEKDKFHAD